MVRNDAAVQPAGTGAAPGSRDTQRDGSADGDTAEAEAGRGRPVTEAGAGTSTTDPAAASGPVDITADAVSGTPLADATPAVGPATASVVTVSSPSASARPATGTAGLFPDDTSADLDAADRPVTITGADPSELSGTDPTRTGLVSSSTTPDRKDRRAKSDAATDTAGEPAESPSEGSQTPATPEEDLAAPAPVPTLSRPEDTGTDTPPDRAVVSDTSDVAKTPATGRTDPGEAEPDEDDAVTLVDTLSDTGDTLVGADDDTTPGKGAKKAPKDTAPLRSREDIARWIDSLGTTADDPDAAFPQKPHPLGTVAAEDITVAPATADGEIGTPDMAGLLKALDAARTDVPSTVFTRVNALGEDGTETLTDPRRVRMPRSDAGTRFPASDTHQEALYSFERAWRETTVDRGSQSRVLTAATDAHLALGGTPDRVGALVGRFARYVDDFGRLSPADQHVAVVAQTLLGGRPSDTADALRRARAAGVDLAPGRVPEPADPGPVPTGIQRLTDADRTALDRAADHLRSADPEEAARAEHWARSQVSADHTWFLDADHPGAAERRELIDAFVTLVAHSRLTDSADRTRALSLELARRYGTRRITGLPGEAGPDVVVPADAAGPEPTAGPSRQGADLDRLLRQVQDGTDQGVFTGDTDAPPVRASSVFDIDEVLDLTDDPAGGADPSSDVDEVVDLFDTTDSQADSDSESAVGTDPEPDPADDGVTARGGPARDAAEEADQARTGPAPAETAPHPGVPVSFRTLMEPLRSYARNATDRTARDVEVVLLAAPGSNRFVEMVRSARTGHALVAVRLPGHTTPVAFGFRTVAPVSNHHLVDGTAPGGVTAEGPRAFNDFGAEILGAYKINADQLAAAYRYAEDNSLRGYHLQQYNCVTFALGFVEAATGEAPVRLRINSPNSLIRHMRVGQHRDWVTDPKVLELTAEDQADLTRAAGWLRGPGRTRHLEWARDRVLIDHQRPVLSLTRTVTQQRQLDLLASFTMLVAERHGRYGEAAALALLHDLGVRYGTARTHYSHAEHTVTGMLEPLRTHALNAADPHAPAAEVVVLARPKGTSVAVHLRGTAKPIAFRFAADRAVADRLRLEDRDGGVFIEHTDLVHDPDVEILQSYSVDAVQLLAGHQYLADNVVTEFNPTFRNSDHFTRALLTAMIGSDPVKAYFAERRASAPSDAAAAAHAVRSLVLTHADFLKAMRSGTETSWSSAATPRTELTGRDSRAETVARERLRRLPAAQRNDSLAWARLRVRLDHQRAARDDRPMDTIVAQGALLQSFQYLIGAEHATEGDQPARLLSWRLGLDYGTWRLADGLPPELAVTDAPLPAPTVDTTASGPRDILLEDLRRPMTEEGGFHWFATEDGGTVYISSALIDGDRVDTEVARQVITFLGGGLRVFHVHGLTGTEPGTGHAGRPVLLAPAGEADFPRADDVDATSFVALSTTQQDAERRFRASAAAGSDGTETGVLAASSVLPDQTVAVIDATTVHVQGGVLLTVTDSATVRARPRVVPSGGSEAVVLAAQTDAAPYKHVLEQKPARVDLSPERRQQLHEVLNTHDPDDLPDVPLPPVQSGRGAGRAYPRGGPSVDALVSGMRGLGMGAGQREQPFTRFLTTTGQTNGPVSGLDFRAAGRERPGAMLNPNTDGFVVFTGPVVPGAIPYELAAAPITAPWAGRHRPFFVVADLTPQGIPVVTPGGNQYLSPHQFADHLAEDRFLSTTGRDTPLVLVIPDGGAHGLELPRIIAARTGKGVWSSDLPVTLRPGADRASQWIVQHRAGSDSRSGRWLYSGPSDTATQIAATSRDVSVYSTTRNMSGPPLSDLALASYTVIDSRGQTIGRASHTEQDLTDGGRDPRTAAMSRWENAVYWHVTTLSGGRLVPVHANSILPWKAPGSTENPYFFAAHGIPGSVFLVDKNQTEHSVSGTTLGGIIRRRPSFSGKSSVVLTVCQAGANPAHPSGGTAASVAQEVADVLQVAVHAPTGFVTTGLASVRDGEWVTVHPGNTASALPPGPPPGTPRHPAPGARRPAPPGPPPSMPLPPAPPGPPPGFPPPPAPGGPFQSADEVGDESLALLDTDTTPMQSGRGPGRAYPRGGPSVDALVSGMRGLGTGAGQSEQPVTRLLTTTGQINGPVSGLDFRAAGRERPGAMLNPNADGFVVFTGPVVPGAIPYELAAAPVTAPWAGRHRPFFVVADLTPQGIPVVTPGGNQYLSPHQFADHLAEDRFLSTAGRDTPLVLVIPDGGAHGLELPRIIAARTGMGVWSSDLPVTLRHDEDGEDHWIVQQRRSSNSRPGQWLYSGPSDATTLAAAASTDVSVYSSTRNTEGPPLNDLALASYTVLDSRGQTIGRASHTERDLTQSRTADMSRWENAVSWFATSHSNGRPVRLGANRILPWRVPGSTESPYFFAAHGDPGTVTLVDKDQAEHSVSGTTLGRIIKRRPSFSGKSSVVLTVCQAGATPTHPSGGNATSVAQEVADVLQIAVHAPTGFVRANLISIMDGEWVTVHPRNTATALPPGPPPRTPRHPAPRYPAPGARRTAPPGPPPGFPPPPAPGTRRPGPPGPPPGFPPPRLPRGPFQNADDVGDELFGPFQDALFGDGDGGPGRYRAALPAAARRTALNGIAAEDTAGGPVRTDDDHAAALRMFERMWGKTSADRRLPGPLVTAVIDAYTAVGGTPRGVGRLVTRFDEHASDFTALSPADQHVAVIAQRLLRGTKGDADAAAERARAAGVTFSDEGDVVAPAGPSAVRLGPVRLTAEDRSALDAAEHALLARSVEDLASAERWARQQVSADHTWYVDGNHPDAAERRDLLAAFVTLLSHRQLTDGPDAARALSLELAGRYRTRRTTGMVGGTDEDTAAPDGRAEAGPSRAEPLGWGQEDDQLGRRRPVDPRLQTFDDFMEPVRRWAQNAQDRTSADIDVLLMAYPGVNGFVQTVRTQQTGHAFIAVRVPDEEKAVSFGFTVQTETLNMDVVVKSLPGGVTQERPDAPLDFHAEVLATYRVNADQLAAAYEYAKENSARPYNLLTYNCVVFARGFVQAATGQEVGDPKTFSPAALAQQLRLGSQRDWTHHPRFLEPVPADRLALLEAHRWADTYPGTKAINWALTQTFIDHQRPVFSGPPTKTLERQRDLLQHFATLIAHRYDVAGEEAARAHSLELGKRYGTLRAEYSAGWTAAREMLEPLRSYVDGATDHSAKDADVVVLTGPGGQPAVAVRVPGHTELVTVRFGQLNPRVATFFWDTFQGGLFFEHAHRITDPDTEVFAAYAVNAAEVGAGHRYLLEHGAATYSQVSYNEAGFVRGFLTAVLGRDPVGGSGRSSAAFFNAMRPRIDLSWSRGAFPHAEQSPAHRQDTVTALRVLEAAPEQDRAAALAWAELRVAIDHQQPPDAGPEDDGPQPLAELRESFRPQIAAAYLTHGQPAARRLSWRLGQQYNTWRYTDRTPPAPQPGTGAAPAPVRRTVRFGGLAQPMVDEGGFHRFRTPGGGTVYISNDQILGGTVRTAVAEQIGTFINGNLTIHHVHGLPQRRTDYAGEPLFLAPRGEADLPRADDVDATSFVALSTTRHDAEQRFHAATAGGTGTAMGVHADLRLTTDQSIAVIDETTVHVKDGVLLTLDDSAPVAVRAPARRTNIIVFSAQAAPGPYRQVLEQELAKLTLAPEQRDRLQRALNTRVPAPATAPALAEAVRDTYGGGPAERDDSAAGQPDRDESTAQGPEGQAADGLGALGQTGVRHPANSTGSGGWHPPGDGGWGQAPGPSSPGHGLGFASVGSIPQWQWINHGTVRRGADYRVDSQGRREAPVADLVLRRYSTFTGAVPPAVPAHVRGEEAPWSGSPAAPFFIAAYLAPSGVEVATYGGRRILNPEQFAQHVAEMTGAVHSAGPIVLLIPYAAADGMHLPRVVAARTQRTVWATDGPVAFRPQVPPPGHEGRDPATLIVLSRANATTAMPRWLPSTPDILAHNPDGEPQHQIATSRGPVQAASLASHTLVDERGEHLGRALFNVSDWAIRSSTYTALQRQRGWTVGQLRKNADGRVDLTTSGSNDYLYELPWINSQRRNPYHFAAHGLANQVFIYDLNGRHRITDGNGLGNLLKRRPSLVFDRTREIVLQVCESGTPAADGKTTAQQVADVTGRTVYAPDGLVAVHMTNRESVVQEGRAWRTFHPRNAQPAAPQMTGPHQPPNYPPFTVGHHYTNSGPGDARISEQSVDSPETTAAGEASGSTVQATPSADTAGPSREADGREAWRSPVQRVLETPADNVDTLLDSVWSSGVDRPLPADAAEASAAEVPTAGSDSGAALSGLENIPDLLRVGAMRRIGPGVDRGGFYEGDEGQRFYVEERPSADHVRNEILAASLYRLGGVEVTPVKPAVVDGKPAVAVEVHEMQDDAADHMGSSGYRTALHDGFAVDAWLGNEDVAHVVVTVDAKPLRASAQGALLYRATGAAKGPAFGTQVTEWETLRDPEVSEENASLFSDISRLKLSRSVDRAVSISAEAIESAVDAVGFEPERAGQLKNILRERQSDLARRQKIRNTKGEGGSLANMPDALEFSVDDGTPAFSDPDSLFDDGPGDVHQGADGEKFYVEAKPSADHVRNQVLAAKLYRLVGVPAPDVRFAVLDGKPAAAVLLPGTTDRGSVHDDAYRAEAQKDFAADAWLGNSHMVDNIVVVGGRPLRARLDGVLLYRSMGGEKGFAFGADVTEWHKLRDPAANRGDASLFSDMSEEARRESVTRLMGVPDEAIDEAVDSAGFSPVRATRLKQVLRLRRADLAAKAGIVEKGPLDAADPGSSVAGPRRPGWVRALREADAEPHPDTAQVTGTALTGLENLPDLVHADGMRKVVAPSAPSGQEHLYENDRGQRFYVEERPSADHVRHEVLAAHLYRLTHVAVARVEPAVLGGKPATAVQVENFRDDSRDRMWDSSYRARAQRGFATDAWLGNEALPHTFVTVDGAPVRASQQGALFFRPTGEAKGDAFGAEVTAWETLRDPAVNRDDAALFADMSAEALHDSAQGVLRLPDAAVDTTVDSVGFDVRQAERLKELLRLRRADLAARVVALDAGSMPGPLIFSNARKADPPPGAELEDLYEDSAGGTFHVHEKRSADHARNEVLAARLYQLTGVPAPDVRPALLDGNAATAIAVHHGAIDIEDRTQDAAYRAEIQKGFAADAWLGNAYVARSLVTVDDVPVRALSDNALLFRSTGEAKGLAFGADVTEWVTLRDPGVNQEDAALFAGMSAETLRHSVQRVLDIPAEAVDAAVDGIGLDPARAAWLKTLLQLRRADLAEKARLPWAAPTEVQRHDVPDGARHRPAWLRSWGGAPAENTGHPAEGVFESAAPMTAPAAAWRDDNLVRLASAHDLMVVRWLSSSDARLFETEVAAELVSLLKAKAYARGTGALEAALKHQEQTLAQSAYLFRFLERRAPLRALGAQQLAAVVMAEREGLSRIAEDERRLAEDAWQESFGSWATQYPESPARKREIIKAAHHMLRERMQPMLNLPLNATLPDGSSILDSILGRSDSDNRVLRNLWETAYFQEDPDGTFEDGAFRPQTFRDQLHARGAVEEFLGYAAALRRTADSGGIYATGRPGWRFAPQDVSHLPVYASLTSLYRPHGLPAYGTTVIYLKREVLQRATFTPRDSYRVYTDRETGVVTGQGNMLPLLIHGEEEVVRLALAEATDFMYDRQLREFRDQRILEAKLMENAYIETQINGSVTWADLDRIVLIDDGGFDGGKETAHQLMRRLDRFARERGYSFTVEVQYPRVKNIRLLNLTGPDAVRGDVHEDRHGNAFHIRQTSADQLARNEILAARLYRLAGIPAMGSQLVLADGRLGVMSPFRSDARFDVDERRHDLDYRAEIQKGFAVDAWLANRNVAGEGYGNILTSQGEPVRVNTGMVLSQDQQTFTDTAFRPDVVEWETLRDARIHPETATLFSGMSDGALRDAVQRVLDIPAEDIDTAVDSVGFGAEQAARLKDLLHQRRADLAARAGLPLTGAHHSPNVPPSPATITRTQDQVTPDRNSRSTQ
ncbi:hypothetical protein [Streptomyces sp. NPDC046988]|uniref:hypothetical protein n=1 Tax=Streptomyces sp. NPDC046988 TaxID=3154922 RepID=UPI00340282CF